MIVGIMGKVGSGKSAAVKFLRENYDAVCFSCDDVAKELIESGEIDYKIENPYMFFTDPLLQERCREKVHKPVFLRIFKNISEQIAENPDKLFVIETALPNEDFIDRCDKLIFIDIDYDKKLALLKEHRAYIDNQVKVIHDSQKYYEKFYDKAHIKIKNDGSKEELLSKVKEAMDEICITRK